MIGTPGVWPPADGPAAWLTPVAEPLMRVAKAWQMRTAVINKVCAEAEIRTDGAATADEPGSPGSTFGLTPAT